MEYIAKWLFASALFALLIIGFAVGIPLMDSDESYSPAEMNIVKMPPSLTMMPIQAITLPLTLL